MQIRVLSADVKTVPTQKGSYQSLELAYKNLTFQGKVEGKKITSFGGGKEAFDKLSVAQSGQVFELDAVKNEKGYLDWLNVRSSVASPSAQPTQSPAGGSINKGNSTAQPATRSTYETPEERAKKQIYIVRQSSLSGAINLLGVGAKTPPKVEDVVKTARLFEAFVMGDDVKIDSGMPEDMTDSEIE